MDTKVSREIKKRDQQEVVRAAMNGLGHALQKCAHETGEEKVAVVCSCANLVAAEFTKAEIEGFKERVFLESIWNFCPGLVRITEPTSTLGHRLMPK